VKCARVTVFAMPQVCRNWQNAYIISLSKGLDALEGQAAAAAAETGLYDPKIVMSVTWFDGSKN
jgi:hypothetical protein